MLPVLLKPAEKRALDLISDWPWITLKELAGLLDGSPQRASRIVIPLEGFGLAARPRDAGGRLALTDRGLALLARRDRTSVAVARSRWSIAPEDPEGPLEWRNVTGRRTRQLLRNIEHTAAVHGFLAALTAQARLLGWEVVQLDPPRRASRHFRHDGGMRSVNPDAFGVLRKGDTRWPFFLEWERRAVRPSTMSARLAPYLRYYSSHRPTDDHGTRPSVLVVFDDEIAHTHFDPPSVEVGFDDLLTAFPLPWSAYVRLLSVRNESARQFYETEALRGGWSVRQLDRQIGSQFYERTALSKNRAVMLTAGQRERPGDPALPGEQIKDPFVLEFLDLKDEYSESDLEEALIRHLESFLLELGDDFCFLGRQRRLRVGSQWYRVDLLFFHRRLRCLVVIDLKIGAFTHADAGQMHFYLNYARQHWVREGENPPVGLILCSEKDEALAQYALEGLSNNVMAAEYRITLPDETTLAAELDRTRQAMEQGTDAL